jgi:molybdopterin-guanine dinucleotide biosynthesis protein A
MSAQPKASVSGIILAGGRSRRLGTDKAFLPLFGEPLVARIARTLAALSDDLIVVTNEPAKYAPLGLAARLVPDDRPGLGSLMGIYSGLKQARHPHALVVACDMPFLSPALLRYLAALADGYDVVIPEIDGLHEPLHAVYGIGCLEPMARLLAAAEHKILALFPQVRVRTVGRSEIEALDPEHRSFLNVNSPEDWERVQGMLNTGSCSPR